MIKLNLIYGFLIGLLIFISSCTSEDKELTTSELLVGTWKQTKVVYVCSTGSENVVEYNDCINNSTITFTSEGKLNRTDFNYECVQSNARSGSWEITDGRLIVTTIEGEGEISLFEITNNTLRLGGYFENNQNIIGLNQYTCDGGNLYSHHYIEYIRIE